MPYTDYVHYKSNHPKAINVSKAPTVVSAVYLEQIRVRADPTLSRITEYSQYNTVFSANAHYQGNKALNRARNWANTDFSNEDIRIYRVLDHKYKIQDEIHELADSYQRRLQERHDEEVAKATTKIEDNSEYSRYLKVARHAADCAQFETEYKQKYKEIYREKIERDRDYKDFLEKAAVKEKQFKSILLERAAADAKSCAEYNEKIHHDLIYDKKMGTAEKNKELQEAKYFHQEWEKDYQREHEEAIAKMEDTKAMFEDYIQREQRKKQYLKLEDKMQFHEELAAQTAKDELASLTAYRQAEFKQRVRDGISKAQQSAEYVIAADEKRKNDAVYSMMLAKIDGERKRQQQQEWRQHWDQLNRETLEMQELQEAERCAMKVADKMEDLAYGRRMIELVEAERDYQGEIVRYQREQKRKQGIEAKQEMENALLRKKQEIATEKEKDRKDLQAAMKVLNEEKQIPIKAALEEDRTEYKQSYQQVMRFMNKMDKTVSWQGDYM